jgi:hypothetical protein
MPLVHFLLAYDRSVQKLVFQQAYGNPSEALTVSRWWVSYSRRCTRGRSSMLRRVSTRRE